MGIGDWGLGIGDWGLGIGPNPQSPIPNPQSPNYRFNFEKKYFPSKILNFIHIKDITVQQLIKIKKLKKIT